MADMETLKALRDQTGFGIMDIKRALEEAGDDVEKARQILKDKSAMVMEKKAGRATKQGLIETYTHLGRIGAMVEVNCETDFVARNDDFKAFVHNLVLHVASMNPSSVEELLEQPYFLDDKITIQKMLEEIMHKIGENMQIRRIARFELGADE
jgi:elongation factor Ts